MMIPTSMDALALRQFGLADAGELHALVQANRGHLGERGEHTDLIAASVEDLREALGGDDGKLRFGMFLHERLIGRVDLMEVEPGFYGIGYWLAEEATGRGYATEALRALLDFVRDGLGAQAVYAGVSHGNDKSTTLLGRLGFVAVAEFEDFTRFGLTF